MHLLLTAQMGSVPLLTAQTGSAALLTAETGSAAPADSTEEWEQVPLTDPEHLATQVGGASALILAWQFQEGAEPRASTLAKVTPRLAVA